MKSLILSTLVLIFTLTFSVSVKSDDGLVVIDFSEMTVGQVFNGDEYESQGVTFSNTPTSHPLVIQNTSDPTLPAPSQDHFNPLQGNALIVSKYTNPNGSVREYASPHTFVMDFAAPVNFKSITTMDNEDRNSKIMVFGENGLIKQVDVPMVPDGTGNWENSLQTVEVNAEGVTQVKFLSSGSTFIDDITYEAIIPGQCPVPEGNAQLFNISTRAFVMNGPAVVIGGFIIKGEDDLCVVIRGRGQSVGLREDQRDLLLPDPYLKLFTPIDGQQTVIATNDNWTDDPEQVSDIIDSGLSGGLTDTDAAIYICLPPGPYTAHLRSAVPGESGIGIVEVIDADNFQD